MFMTSIRRGEYRQQRNRIRESGALAKRHSEDAGGPARCSLPTPWNSQAPLRRPSVTNDGETSMARARRTAHSATPHSGTTLPESPTDGVDRPRSDNQSIAFVPAASELLTIIGRDGCFKHLAPTFPPAFGYT